MIGTNSILIVSKLTLDFFSKAESFENHLIQHLFDMEIFLNLLNVDFLMELIQSLLEMLDIAANDFGRAERVVDVEEFPPFFA